MKFVKHLSILSFIVINIIFFNACQTTKNINESVPFLNTNWVLESINGYSVADIGSNKDATIVFDSDNKIHGNLGCNNFFGIYTVRGKKSIKIEYTGSTKMMCMKMDVENQYAAALKNGITSYVIKGKNLSLMNGNKEILYFKAE
jgi:heat shock protein HslJ